MQLLQAGGVSAGELGASHPAYHPVAADLNQLASGVRPRHTELVLARLLPNIKCPFDYLHLQRFATSGSSVLLICQTLGMLGKRSRGMSG